MFGLVLFPSEDYNQDTGWSFYKTSSTGDSDGNLIYTPDSGGSPYTGVYKAKVFLKFPKDPSHTPGTAYFTNGTPNATEANSLEPTWFLPVAQHQLQITLGTVDTDQPFQSAPQSEATVFFCDPTGKPLGSGGGTTPPSNSLQTTVTTDGNGVGTFYFRAGPQLMQATKIHFKVKELTQKR